MTSASVKIPTPLRSLVGGQVTVDVQGPTVGAALRQLVAMHPALGRHLWTSDGALRNSVAIYRNETDVRTLEKEETPLRDGDVLSIVPAMAGGSGKRRTAKHSSKHPARGTPSSPLNSDELRRYSRHLLLPEFGVAGQQKLGRSKVLIVGAGGLGGPAALYLAAAGVGEIGLADFDRVELSNLQRQILFATTDVGRPKLEAARDRLQSLNPGVRVTLHPGALRSDRALEVLGGYDVVLDATDNFPTRYLVNDACVLLGRPNVYGSIYRFEGQVSVFGARGGPCYRCLYPEPPPPDLVPSCAEAGVLGVLPGVIGTIQATEAIKLLVGIGEPLVGRLLLYDAAAMRFRELSLAKNPDCAVCSAHPTQRGLVDYDAFCGVPAASERGRSVPEITPQELHAALARADPPVLVDVREPAELQISRIEGSLEIPQEELTGRLSELTGASSIVVFCRTGVRSGEAVRVLLDLGFERVRNLKGGINAWAETVDPSLPTY